LIYIRCQVLSRRVISPSAEQLNNLVLMVWKLKI
jgi:hypothetical protein